jgi:hypothetical protein
MPDADSQVKEDRAIGFLARSTGVDLQELTIDAPNGKRKLTQAEATDITRFLGAAACGIINDAKQFRSAHRSRERT